MSIATTRAAPPASAASAKPAIVAVRIQHAGAGRLSAHDSAVFALVQKRTGLLSASEIDDDFYSIFSRDGFRNLGAVRDADPIGKTLLLAHRALAALDNRSRREAVGER